MICTTLMVQLRTNLSGGIQGGIMDGYTLMLLFKPVATIMQKQES
jgi:chorismate synthase